MSVRARHPEGEPRGINSGESQPPRALTINRIAAGVDVHPRSRDAVALAALVADITGAELILVTVYRDPPAPLLTGPDRYLEADAELKRMRTSVRSEVRAVAENDRSVPSGLSRVVRREHCDLLVVGSIRDAPDGRVRIGNRTRELLRSLDCPVAIAPRGMQRLKQSALRKIGVGYDGESESAAALGIAGRLAAVAKAELYLRAVVDDRVRVMLRSALHGLLATEATDVIAEREQRLRDLAIAASEATDANISTEIVRGDPGDALLALSQTVDLLVVGSRRRGPVRRVVLGSTGEAVLHGADCPVLAVPRPAESGSRGASSRGSRRNS